MKKKDPSFSLAFSLAAPLLAITCSGTILITGLAFQSVSRTADSTVSLLGAQIAEEVEESVSALFAIPITLNEVNSNALRSGALDVDNQAARDRFFSGQLRAFPQVSYSFIGREDGSFYGARRNESGQIEAIHNDRTTGHASVYFSTDPEGNALQVSETVPNFDCRTRPWYREALATGAPGYTEVYRHFVFRDLAVTAYLPLARGDGRWSGVLGVDYRLDRINGFMKALAPVNNSLVLLFERENGLLVGNSANQKNYREEAGQIVRLDVAGLGSPLLLNRDGAVGIADLLSSWAEGGEVGKGVTLDTAAGRVRVEVRRIDTYGLGWAALVALPYEVFTATVQVTAREVLILGFLLVICTVILVLSLTRRLLRPIEELILAADRIAHGDWAFRAPQGTYRELQILTDSFNLMADRLHQSIGGLEVAVNDRTKELEEKNRQLSESNATKDTFFAILAHDLRGPIGSLADMLCAIDEGTIDLDDKERQTVGHELALASRSVSQLLENLLTWAASQRGDIAFKPVWVDLDELVSEAIKIVAPAASAKGISIDYGPVSLSTTCDQDMILTVLRNLLSNAVKFTAPGGRIKVLVEETPGGTRVVVSDNGVGMNQETRTNLFTPGRTMRRSGTMGEKGSGLGLRLCKEFVERHGGTIDVASEPGLGSSFAFTLPAEV